MRACLTLDATPVRERLRIVIKELAAVNRFRHATLYLTLSLTRRARRCAKLDTNLKMGPAIARRSRRSSDLD